MAVTPTILADGSLLLKTDTCPLGGFRGKAGAVVIEHSKAKPFDAWNSDEIRSLTLYIQTVLQIYQSANINNVLVYARQDHNQQLQFRMIPYPKCNWIEKIKGLYHAIFGAKNLTQAQEQEVTNFFKEKLTQQLDPYKQPHLQKKEKPDAFCREQVIRNQLIVDVGTYHVLHDRCPKGSTKADPHILIAAQRNEGHQLEFDVKQQYQILTIAQRAFQNLSNEVKHLLFVQRFGDKLPSVMHTHANVIGMFKFPTSFCEKIKAFLRFFWPGNLSAKQLEGKITHYKSYQWNPNKV